MKTYVPLAAGALAAIPLLAGNPVLAAITLAAALALASLRGGSRRPPPTPQS